MKNLIGKKVNGFKFESRDHCIWFSTLEEYIGRVGVIDEYLDMVNVFIVKFGEDCLPYPAELIEHHIIDEHTENHITSAIVEAYFSGTTIPEIRQAIIQAYAAIEAGVNAQLVEVKEEREKL
jgi:hypothetical protein